MDDLTVCGLVRALAVTTIFKLKEIDVRQCIQCLKDTDNYWLCNKCATSWIENQVAKGCSHDIAADRAYDCEIEAWLAYKGY